MELLANLFSFPVILTAAPCLFFLLLMLLSLTTGLLDDWIPDFGQADADLDTDLDLSSSVLLPVGITRVPLVISLTCTLFIASVLLYYLDRYLLTPWLSGLPYQLLALLTLPVVLLAALYGAALALKPLMPLLDRERAFARINYIGMTGEVRSGRVGICNGEIAVTCGARENLLDVFCTTQDDIRYGDHVLILAFDSAQKRYRVAKHETTAPRP